MKRIIRNFCKDLFYKGQHYKEKEKRPAIPVRRYMVYALIVTMAITGVSLSRYATSSSMEDSGRTAKFDVTVECTNKAEMNTDPRTSNLIIRPYGTEAYEYDIKNNSEVSVRGELKVNGSGASAASVIIIVDGVTQGNNRTFTMPAGGAKHVSVFISGVGVLTSDSGESFSFKFDFTQID